MKTFARLAATVVCATALITPATAHAADLNDPRLKDIAMQLVSSAENSSLDWRAQFGYIEDIWDGRGYTAGIIGFCSGTGDMLDLVRLYRDWKPGNVLEKYLPALERVNGSPSHDGLDPTFQDDWRRAAQDGTFQGAQEHERDRVYFNPAVNRAKQDGVQALGQFIYYDAIVMHGDNWGYTDFSSIRQRALDSGARPPAWGGDERAWLHAFLDARVWAMREEPAHENTTRVDTAQRRFLNEGKLNLETPLRWHVYGDYYEIW
ncbi:chitosanase [Lentzea atacamensis]|uniref:Chitosanase n=1 Tax=Lentzea atacamensis TaxID=531938 RepID=A0A316HKB4_9PSEU|nr:chitosanase [Lentzea atacamensis]PWK80727.1 chitosanase [Lentzea atacamensis]RAS64893.1 chitosanase [Lentzea atacamensis]